MAYLIKNRELQKLESHQLQECPLCGEWQTLMMRGKTQDIEDKSYGVVGDRGYSFCNCRNIFFTQWKNIDSRINQEPSPVRKLEVEKEWGLIQKYLSRPKNVWCTDKVAETYLRENNWSNMTFDWRPVHDKKYDLLWLSHHVQGMHSPKDFMNMLKESLSKDGIIFCTMPDTSHINWESPLEWDWNVQENHILWNMYDWIAFVEELGFKCLYGNVSTDVITLENNSREDYHWIKESRTIFKLA